MNKGTFEATCEHECHLTLSDLASDLIESGHIQSCEDLKEPDAHEHARILQRKWISKKHIGCVFARQMSGKPSNESWLDLFSYGDVDVEELTRQVDQSIESGAEAIQIIFPNYVDNLTGFALQISRLLTNPRWHLCGNEKSTEENRFQIGLRFVLPFGNHVSWVLGLGDFDCFPITRRTPFPALIFRTGPPGRAPDIAQPEKDRPSIDSNGRVPVHLADHPGIPSDNESVRRMWQQTQRLKCKVLRNDSNEKYAKAKVTASFSNNLQCIFDV